MNKEDTKKAIEIMQAFIDGKTIETRYKDSDRVTGPRTFVECPSPAWDFYRYEYRVKTAVPDSIDWSQVDEQFVALFRFKSGAKVLCTSIPRLTTDGAKYWTNVGFIAHANAFKSYKQGDLPWDESLVERPQKRIPVVDLTGDHD